MPRNYFIIGEPKAGKTTLLRELVAELKKGGLEVGGFVSPEERHHGTRTAFRVMDVRSGKMAELANVKGDGPKVSKYHVDVRSFESIAVPSMEGFEGYDVFIIDEIGVMEMKSAKFARLLDRIIESDTPLIASLHEQYVDKFGGSGELLELEPDKREEVLQKLLDSARGSIKRKEKRPAKAEEKKAPAKAKAAPKKAPPKKAPAKAEKKHEARKEEPKKAPPPKEEKAPEKEKEKEAPPEEAEKPSEEKKEKKEGFFGKLKKLFGG